MPLCGHANPPRSSRLLKRHSPTHHARAVSPTRHAGPGTQKRPRQKGPRQNPAAPALPDHPCPFSCRFARRRDKHGPRSPARSCVLQRRQHPRQCRLINIRANPHDHAVRQHDLNQLAICRRAAGLLPTRWRSRLARHWQRHFWRSQGLRLRNHRLSKIQNRRRQMTQLALRSC